jgi:hypothetical protein
MHIHRCFAVLCVLALLLVAVRADTPATYYCEDEQLQSDSPRGDVVTWICNNTLSLYQTSDRTLRTYSFPANSLTTAGIETATSYYQLLPICHDVNDVNSNVTVCHLSSQFGRLGECVEIPNTGCEIMRGADGFVVLSSASSDYLTVFSARDNRA